MRNIVNPQQARLFDPFDSVLTEKTRKRLLDGWHGVFRHVILELMPVGIVGGHFDPTMGRPTKQGNRMKFPLCIFICLSFKPQQS